MDRKKTLKYLLLLVTTGVFCVLLAVVLYLVHPDYEFTEKKVTLYQDAGAGVMSTFLQNTGAVVASPNFSCDSGFYNKAFDLTLSAPENCKIYYTIDSSVPTDQSSLYNGPIGTIHTAWNNGSTLGVVFGEDECVKIEED